MLNVINFINNHKDWEEKLTQKPFCLKIKRDFGFIMFSYSQIESDFYNEIVRECRGLIIHEETLTPVCVPLYKFGNYGEGYVPEIDWKSAHIQDKIDGSLIKVWFYDKWRVSTNGTIDAYKAELQSDISVFKTFGDLFEYASLMTDGFDYKKLDPDNTYMFELTSPYNRVVVPYVDVTITHIATRNNKTLQELDVDIGVKKPTTYNLSSLEDCISTAKELPYYLEGYVVVDKNWDRIKIKSPAYVALHHLKGNGVVNKNRIISLIKMNENAEFLNYFPEFTEIFVEMEEKIKNFIKKSEKILKNAEKCTFNSRKSFAEYAKSYNNPSMLFLWYDGKIKNAEEWLWNHSEKDIVDIIERG